MKHIFSLLLVLFCVSSSFQAQTAFAKKERAQSFAKSSEAKLGSSAEIWVDPAPSKEKADYSYQSDSEESAEASKPFSIIFFLILALIVVVGIMLLSIFNLGAKKKQTSPVSSHPIKESNFRLLDSLALDGGKALHLVQLFNRKFLIASNWFSINLVSEVEGEWQEAEEAPQEKLLTGLDFMTIESEESNPTDEEDAASSISKLGNYFNQTEAEIPAPLNQAEIKTSRNLKNNVLSSFGRNFINGKAAPAAENKSEDETSDLPKLLASETATENNSEPEITASKREQSEAGHTIVKRQAISDIPVETHIQRTPKPPASSFKAKEVPGITKKPSWLQEREKLRQQEANNWRNKLASEKQVLPDLKPQVNQEGNKPNNNHLKERVISSAANLAAKVNDQKNFLEELSLSQNSSPKSEAASPAPKTKTTVSRKISIVE